MEQYSVKTINSIPADSNGDVNALFNSYSTNEIKTGGTWIDGKPIYRKVFSGSISTIVTHIPFDASDKKIIKIDTYFTDPANLNGMEFSGNIYVNGVTGDYYEEFYVIYSIDDLQFTIVNKKLNESGESTFVTGVIYIIVEYTKITD